MSDTENEKPKLGMRAPLGLKRTVETGKVKQSFSHGRSNTVVVEVKRRRVLGPNSGGPADAAGVEETPTPAPAAEQEKPGVEERAPQAAEPAPAPVEEAPKPVVTEAPAAPVAAPAPAP